MEMCLPASGPQEDNVFMLSSSPPPPPRQDILSVYLYGALDILELALWPQTPEVLRPKV